MNMTKVPAREEKRNKALIKDYQSGKFNSVDLVSKYKITVTRIYEILNKYGIERKNPS
jgi:Mor family transcriptional regulator